MTIKIRVFWEKDEEIETALGVTNAIDSILDGKQVNLGIKRLGIRRTNDPPQSFGFDVEKTITLPFLGGKLWLM